MSAATPFPLNQTAVHADIERIRSHIQQLLDGEADAEPHELVRQVMEVLWAHEDDPLVLTACIWALNAIIKHDPSTQPVMNDVGVLELLHRFLKMESFARLPVRRYAIDLITEICKPYMQAPIRAQQKETDVQNASPSQQQHNEEERPVTGFLPYYWDKSNAQSFDDLFPPGLDYESPRIAQFPVVAATPKKKRKQTPVLPALKSPSPGKQRKSKLRTKQAAGVDKLADIDPLAAGPNPFDLQLGSPTEMLGEFSSEAAPLKAEQYIKRQQAILQRIFNPAVERTPHTPRTQHSIVLRLFELCKSVDTEGTGTLPAHQFRSILQCVCYWLQSTELSQLMPHANSETTIRYDELLVAGRVTLIQQAEAPLLKKISYQSWLDKQRKSNNAHSNTWKSHILWFRQSRAEACVWLMRRANRAAHHLAIIGQTERQLAQYGLRAKTFLALREMGQRASQRGNHCANIIERFKQRVRRAKLAVTKRNEAQKFLAAKAADAQWLCKLERMNTMKAVQRANSDRNGQITKDYGWALNRRAYQAEAVRQLVHFAEKAMKIYLHQIELYAWFQAKVQTARTAIARRRQAHEWLLNRGYAAVDCVRAKKRALYILEQKAEKGRKQIVRRAETYEWLGRVVLRAWKAIENRRIAQRWLAARAHIERGRDVVYMELCEKGRNAIRACLLRDQAHEWLVQQGKAARSNAVVLQANFKRSQETVKLQNATQEWLVQRAAAAQAHGHAKYKSFVWLQRRATLARVALGEQSRAVSELWTLASHAMLCSYRQFARKGKRRIHAGDQRRQKELRGQPAEAQWKAELQEAFIQICRGYSHPHQPPEENSLNMLQFRRLICGGRQKILNISVELIPDCFRFVDADKSGKVSFSELFTWFRHEANTLVRQGKQVKIHCADIISVEERALIASMHLVERRLQARSRLEQANIAAVR